MEYRHHQGITLSEIGVGCYALSGAYGQKDPASYREMLLSAVNAGVTFFDTANTYGDLAETLLGETIKPFRQSLILATKVGMRSGNQPDLSCEGITQACEESLRRLQTDWIDLYQVHFDDPTTQVSETVSALEQLVQSGKIRRYGIGHLPMTRIQAYLETGRVFSGQFELSTVARENRTQVQPLLGQYGAAMLAFSVTGRGLLSGRYNHQPQFGPGDIRSVDPLFQRDRFSSALRVTEQFARLGQLYGKTGVQVAIAWVLAQPGVLCALTGPSSTVHLLENIGGSGWKIAGEHLSELETFFAEEDHKLQIAQVSTVQNILQQPVALDPATAIQDLIYVIETSICAGWMSQEAVMPIFITVFNARKNRSKADRELLERAQHELAALIQIGTAD